MIRALAAVAALCVFAAPPAAAAEPYAPMAAFAPLAGKSFRGEWSGPDGKTVVDIATWELILGGRALQSTHRIEGSSYGGRSIFFFDEGAKTYVYHYFTTAGFHTTGEASLADGVLVASEEVRGHPTIARVTSRSTLAPDELRVDVVYVGKDGTQTPSPSRVYKPIADPGPLFPVSQ